MPKLSAGSGTMNPGDQMMPPPSGPGGCKSPEECQHIARIIPRSVRTCTGTASAADAAASRRFTATSYPTGEGANPPIEPAGPGGCSSPEECQAYCTNNPSACQNFAPRHRPFVTAPAPDSQTFLPADHILIPKAERSLARHCSGI